MSDLRILVTHGWLRGNLGDFLITYELLKNLRELVPGLEICLMSIPGIKKIKEHRLVLDLLDDFIEGDSQDCRPDFFKNFHMIINAPGGGLQDPGDKRAPAILRDAQVCAENGLRHAMGSHSFHPAFDLDPLRHSLVIAREPRSGNLLKGLSIPHVESADLSFLHDYASYPDKGPSHKDLLFLRFDLVRKVEFHENSLFIDGQAMPCRRGNLVLTSSDEERDYPKLKMIQKKFNLPYVQCETLGDLMTLIRSSETVISDRYHPIIFAKAYQKPFRFLLRPGSLRDQGLLDLFSGHSFNQIQSLAKAGVSALAGGLLKNT